jgi:hypothetical protein
VDIQPRPGRRRRHEGAAAGRNAIRTSKAANFSLLNTTRLLLLLLNTKRIAPDTPREPLSLLLSVSAGEKNMC